MVQNYDLLEIDLENPKMGDLAMRYLQASYPICRIKSGKFFKRGVVVHGVHYFLPRDAHSLYLTLFAEIELLYPLNQAQIRNILYKFYKI